MIFLVTIKKMNQRYWNLKMNMFLVQNVILLYIFGANWMMCTYGKALISSGIGPWF